jgi:alpha-tubulin suppressor-like RCC1 family protein
MKTFSQLFTATAVLTISTFLAALAAADARAVCTPPPAGIVGWWPADGNARDVIGGNNGSPVGAVGYTNGEVGQAIVLSGNMELVTVGNPTSLQLQDFTIEAWVQRNNTSIVSYGTAGNGIIFGYGYGGYGLYLDPSGRPALSNIGIDETKPSVAITDTAFHHLAVTKSGSTVVFYVDGIAYSAPAYNPGFVFSTVAAIGGRGDNLDNSFFGLIDEVAVYNRALSVGEIQAIYNAGSAGKCAPVVAANECTPPPAGLVGWWPAEGNANDIIGTNNGTLQGGISFAPGEVNQAFNFNNTNADVFIPASSSLDVGTGTGFTVEAWISPTDVTQAHPLFEWNNGTYWGVHFHIAPGQPFNNNPGPGELYANITDTAGSWHQLSSPGGVVVANVFQHVALTYDEPSGLATIYCNGQIVGQQNIGSFTPLTSYNLYLGQRPAPSDEMATFAGLMDEPAVYHRALSSNEIAAIYNAGSAGKCASAATTNNCVPPPAGLVSWWPGAGNANDVAGGNSGTWTGSGNLNAYAPGIVGQAMVFDGTHRDRVDLGNSANLQLQNFTIESWVKRASATVVSLDENFADGSFAGPGGYILGYGAGGYALVVFDDGSFGLTQDSVNDTRVPPVLTDTNWHHVALTKAGTLVTAFVDGVQQPTPSLNPYTNVFTFTTPAAIASRGDGGGNTFYGLIDELTVYNLALSSNEIVAIYNAGSAGKCTSTLAGSTGVPAIFNFSPTTGTNGAVVAIAGTNFSANAAANIVCFGAVRANVLSASANSLIVTVPAGATFAPITVTVNVLTAWANAPFSPTFGAGTNSLTLAPRLDLPTIDGPGIVAFADLDGDGKPDLLVATGNQGISIYQNISSNGTVTAGSFAPPVNLPLATGLQAMTVADVDGDGKLDIVLLNRNSTQVMILKNISTPGLLTTNSLASPVSFSTGNDPRSVVVRDLDGDGLPDIAVANWADGTVYVYQNLGTTNGLTTNSFAAPIVLPVGSGPQDLKAADLDGDGLPDLVTANNNYGTTNSVSLLRNTSTPGNLSFAPQVALAGLPTCYSIAIGDLDGDGKLDLVVSSFINGQAVSVYRNTGSPGSLTTNSFAANVDFGLGGWGNGVAIADLDGDGKPDLAVVRQLADGLCIFKNISTPGSFTTSSLAPRVDYPTGWNPNGIAIGDLDGDGRPEIAFAISYGATLSIYQNQTPFGTPTPSPPTCTPAPSGLVGWWKGEGNANDTIGANNGMLSANGATYASAEVGMGFRLDGTNGYVKIPDSAALKPTNVTVEAWVWLDPTATGPRNEHIVFKQNSWNAFFEGYSLLKMDLDNGDGTYTSRFQSVVSRTGNQVAINSTTIVQRGVWYHVAMTYDGNELILYVNGVPENSAIAGFALDYGTEPLFLGTTGTWPPYLNMFAGTIDEASIYNRALATNEIAAIYSAGSAGKCPALAAPLIVNQPVSQTNLVGDTVVFSATATGTQPLTYQWSFDGTNIAGATNSSLILLNVQASQAGNYAVLVTNLYGSAMSSNASLTVIVPAIPPMIISQTPNQIVLLGNPATFGVTASGSTPLSYFWSRNGALIPNATNASYTLLNAQLSDSGSQFSCLVTNAFGSAASSNMTLKVIDSTVANDLCSGAILITNASYTNSQSTVAATSFGDPVPDCVDGFGHGVWYQFTAPVAGQLVVDTFGSDFDTGMAIYTGTCDALTEVACDDDTVGVGVTSQVILPTTAGTTYFILAGGYASDAGNLVLHLNHLVAPAFVVQPADESVVAGRNASFSVTVSGALPMSFQWYFNNNPLTDDGRIVGSLTANLVISNVTTADAGSYSLMVTNFLGSTNSSAATLAVLVPPVITTQPVGRSVPPGLPTIFTAAASGIPTPGYQWQLNGTNLVGAISANYTNAAIGTNDLGFYQVIASNSVGVATSTVAQLTFGPVAAWGLNSSGECLPPPGLSNVLAVAGSPGASFAVQASGNLVAWGSAIAANVPASATNIVAMAGLGNYALRSDGSVVHWSGLNVSALSNIVSVAGGNSTAGYAVRAEGSLAAWGNPAPGPLAPGLPAGLNHLTAIACGMNSPVGYLNAVALKNDGTVVVSGSGAVTNIPAGLSNVVAVAAGYTYAMALRADGKVVAWGSGTGTNLPAGMTNIVAISAGNVPGENFGLAVRANGTVVTWGDDPDGETSPPAALSNLVSIAGAAAAYHGLALVDDGSPVILHPPVGLTAYTGRSVALQATVAGALPLSYQWLLNGTNVPGATNTSLVIPNVQLANAGNYQLFASNLINTAISLPAPVNVISNNTLTFLTQTTTGVTNYQASKITVGSVTVLGSGPLSYQWYFNPNPSSSKIYSAVSGATNDTLVLDPALAWQSGSYYLAVSNGFIQPNQSYALTSTPVTVRVLFATAWGFNAVSNPPVNVTNAVAIATGGAAGLFVGDYFALGSDGKLASWANYTPIYGETNVSALTNSFVTAIAAGYEDSLALKSDGTVNAWGYNLYGETNVPSGLSGVTAIACGPYHDLALKSDGTVVGWGATGQYNFGQTTNNPAATNVVAIAAGTSHTLALRADGSVVQWGNTGDLTIIPSTVTNVIAIAAGGNFNVALRANGTVVQWGSGLLSYPTPVNLSNVVAITASGTHATALKNDGTVATWGNEYVGLASNNLPSNLANVIAITSGGDHDMALFGTRAPAFTVQPRNRTVFNTATSVWFSAKCAGVQPVTYQWQLDGTNIPAATNDMLTINASVNGQRQPLPLSSGVYQLIVSNAYGVVASKYAKLTVEIPLGLALNATNRSWITTGNAPWYGQTNYSHDGVAAARSGGIGGLQQSILQTTLTTNVAGIVSFWWKVSSEQFFDTLEFDVNGAVQSVISGEVDWQQASFPVAAGTNVLVWRYSKDPTFDAGLDAGFVDQFAFAPGGPRITLQPASQVVSLGTNVTFTVAAVGGSLTYQWWHNGTPLANYPVPALTWNNVGRAQDGNYYAIVTDSLTGLSTVSSNATLKVLVPQHLGTPVLLPDGSLQLTSGDANGGTLSPSDLPNFEAQASTDLVNWVTLPNALSLTNGMLLLQDSGSNYTARYYRIIEH